MTLKGRKSSHELRDRMVLVSIRNCIQKGRLRWFRHVEGMYKDSWVKKYKEFVVVEVDQERRGMIRVILEC